jgi:hypothetical protein
MITSIHQIRNRDKASSRIHLHASVVNSNVDSSKFLDNSPEHRLDLLFPRYICQNRNGSPSRALDRHDYVISHFFVGKM